MNQTEPTPFVKCCIPTSNYSPLPSLDHLPSPKDGGQEAGKGRGGSEGKADGEGGGGRKEGERGRGGDDREVEAHVMLPIVPEKTNRHFPII